MEYIIILALIAISAMTAWQLFGDSLIGAAEGSAETLETLDSNGGGGPSAGGGSTGAGGGSAGAGGAGAGNGSAAGGGGSAGGGNSGSTGGGSAMGAEPSQGGSGVVGGGSAMGGGTVITSRNSGGGEDDDEEDPQNGEGASGIYVAPGTDEEEFDPFGFGAVMSVFFALAIPLVIMLKKARGSGGE